MYEHGGRHNVVVVGIGFPGMTVSLLRLFHYYLRPHTFKKHIILMYLGFTIKTTSLLRPLLIGIEGGLIIGTPLY